MRSIEDKIKGINLVSEKFNSLRSEFTSNQQIIVDILKKIIDKHATDFSLTKENSIRKLNFYSVVYRVKEKGSFSEKLIRNNDYNMFSDFLTDLENINQPELKNKIKEIDDLIGIKILTDLNIDSINMFKLISSTNFIKEAYSNGIEIDSNDLKSQPVKMRNGLNIFKLRCKYDTWKFELQIKSKLESAWGDMEHSIFYKDYKITPVRDLAQQSMNHIGKLIIEIDEFLQEIREANDNFSFNSNIILFINEFEKIYAEKVSTILNGISYNFKKIAPILYNIKSSGVEILKNNDIDTKYLSLTCPKYEYYINTRSKDFDLQIFESIIFSSLEDELSQENIEENLDQFFYIIKDSYKKMILNNKIVQTEELAERYTELFFNNCINHNCNEFILNTKNVYDHINNIKLLEEIIDVLEFDDKRLEEILSLYTVFCFGGDHNSYTNNIDKQQLLENLEQTKYQLQEVDMGGNIYKNLNSLINILG